MQERYETSDIFRGAYFLCHGSGLSGIRVDNNGRRTATFLIEGDDISELDRAYSSGKALVNPVQLRETLNCLRDKLFAKLRDNEKRGKDDREREDRRYKAGR